MIKKILLCILGISLSISIFSQNQMDSIQAIKVFGGYTFESNGKQLSYDSMLEMMKDNPEAYQYMSNAKSNATFATILGCAGGFMVGWTVGTALGGGKPNWILAGVGGGLFIVSIPINNSANNNALTAIKKYNSSRKGLTSQNQIDLKFGLSVDGLSLRLSF